MKKILITIGITATVLVGVLIFMVILLMNKDKTSISAEEFNATMENKGYVMTDTTSQFAQYENYVTKSYAAQKTGYQIEFYELSSEDNAIGMYETNKEIFESEKTGTSVYTATSLNNYATYSLVANGKYKYLSRIDNTLIYVNVDESYKDAVEDIMEEIGY